MTILKNNSIHSAKLENSASLFKKLTIFLSLAYLTFLSPPVFCKSPSDLKLNFDTNYHSSSFSKINLKEVFHLYFKQQKPPLAAQIVSTQNVNNSIRLILSDGKYIELDLAGQAKNIIDLVPQLPDFIIRDKGINGAYWIDDSNLLVYHLSKLTINTGLSLTWLSINENNVNTVSSLVLESVDENELDAKGGGMSLYGSGPDVLLATGAGGADNYPKTQDSSSRLGKILKIDIESMKQARRIDITNIEILANGLRNPLGIASIGSKNYFTDNGPRGGDIFAELINGGNYGRDKFEYGRPYDAQKKLYNKKPINYIEPIYYWSPSIAPTALASCPFPKDLQGYGGCILVASLRGQSIFIMKLQSHPDLNRSYVQSIEQINVKERIRQILTIGNTVYLFTDSLIMYKIKYQIFRPVISLK